MIWSILFSVGMTMAVLTLSVISPYETPGLFGRVQRSIKREFHRIRHAAKERVNNFCRNWLLKRDSEYRLRQAQYALVHAREEAREKGIGPDDPRYPTIRDFYKLPDLSRLAE